VLVQFLSGFWGRGAHIHTPLCPWRPRSTERFCPAPAQKQKKTYVAAAVNLIDIFNNKIFTKKKKKIFFYGGKKKKKKKKKGGGGGPSAMG